MAGNRPADWVDALSERVDRRRVLVGWLLPGGAAIAAMAVGFILVGAVLMVREQLILGTAGVPLLALAVMYLFPHPVAGYLFGRRHGSMVTAPVAAGLAPVGMFVLGLVLFGGPVLTPARVPLVTLGAIAGWSLLFGAGMALGTRLTRAS